MRIQNSVTYSVIFFFIVAVFSAFGAEEDYTTGYDLGYNDLIEEAPDRSQEYWNAFLENPNQQTYDQYLGYVDGYAANNPNYTGEPYPQIGGEQEPGVHSNREQIDRLTSYQQTHLGTKRVARHYRYMTRKLRKVQAGDVLNNPSLSFDYSFASVDDNILDGSGHENEGSIFFDTEMGEKVKLGLGISKNHYEIDAADWDQSTESFDIFSSYYLTERCTIGAFITFSTIDIEDQKVGGVTLGGDRFDRWGAGLLSSWNMDIGDIGNLGLTGALTSMNKSSLGRIADDEDSAGLLMADLEIYLSDDISLNTYASYFGLLDRETGADVVDPADGSYYTLGADLNLKLGDSAALTIGYETTASDNDRQENRLNAGFTIYF